MLLYRVLIRKFLLNMSPGLPQLNSSEVIRVLQKIGFVEARQSGAHKIFRHPENRRFVLVPMHGGQDIKKGTLHSIIKQAGIARDEFIEMSRG